MILKMKKTWLKLVASILICQAAGLIGSVFTTPAISGWYVRLKKPRLTPPNWVFAPVWTTLFVLMGISLWLVWKKSKKNSKAKTALRWFFVQLGLNTAWSILFFGLKNPVLGLVDILILDLVLIVVIVKFWRVSKIASTLLWPYLAWLGLATWLNLQVVILN